MFNFELLFLLLVLIGIFFLGVVVYFNNPRSITHKNFLFLAIATFLLDLFNYLYFQPNIGNSALYFLRIHMFFAVWYVFAIFNFFYFFPEKEIKISNFYRYGLLFLILVVSVINLTPLTFEKITSFTVDGRIGNVKINFGIFIFGFTVLILFLTGLFFFIKRMISIFIKKENESEIIQQLLILLGFFMSFSLRFVFSYIFPNYLNNTKYVGYGAYFSIPFIIFTSYAILRFKFLNVKTLITEFFIIIILVLGAFQLANVKNFFEVLIKLLVFFGLVFISFLLLRSTRKEFEQREQLAELNKKLEDLNRLKSEFLSFASHQLKSPLAVIKGYATLVSDGSISNVPDQAKDFAIKIKDSVDKLLELIEEFMDYRKIEENKMDFNFENVEIVSLIKDFIKNFEILAKDKNLQLIFEPSIDNAMVKIDKTRFMQVIQNLVDNAIKYTPSGWVKIGIKKEDNSVLICVCDSGLGMSKELQEKLFGQFVREPSIKKEIRGTGLGLYIAKNIIEAHNGKIWAESEGENKGSKFFVKIPLIEN